MRIKYCDCVLNLRGGSYHSENSVEWIFSGSKLSNKLSMHRLVNNMSSEVDHEVVKIVGIVSLVIGSEWVEPTIDVLVLHRMNLL